MLTAAAVRSGMKADKSVVLLANYMSLIEKAAADGNRFVLLEYCDCMDGNKDKAMRELEKRGFRIVRKREWSGCWQDPGYYAEW